jgi:hypothetical protein
MSFGESSPPFSLETATGRDSVGPGIPLASGQSGDGVSCEGGSRRDRLFYYGCVRVSLTARKRSIIALICPGTSS